MSSLVQQTRQLERVIRRKEKIFLMEQYAASLLQQLEPLAGEGTAEEQVIDALRIAYRYVNPELGNRVSALLVAYGFTGDLEAEREAAEEAEAATFAEEAEEEAPPPTRKGRAPRAAGDGPLAEGEEDEEAGVLFERDIYTGRKSNQKRAGGAADAEAGEVADLFADEEETGLPDGDADDLFADEGEAESGEDPRAGEKAKSRRGAVDEEEDAADLLADEDEAEDRGKTKAGKKAKSRRHADDEEDAADLFADEDEDEGEAEDKGKSKAGKKAKSRRDADDEEDAADLFADEDEDEGEAEDKGKSKAGKKAKSRRDADDEEDAADLFADEDEGEAADLFADGDEAEGNPKATAGKKAESRRHADDEEDAADLFADEDEEDLSASSPKGAAKKKGKGGRGDADSEEDAADLFDEGEDEEPARKGAKKKGGKTPSGAASGPAGDEEEKEEDEEAGALFEQDIYTAAGKKKKKRKRRAGGEDGEPGDPEIEAAEEKDTRRFKPTQGHVRKETPGFAAPEAAVERDERNRRGYDLYAPEEEPPAKEQESKLKGRKPPRSVEEGEEEEEEEEEERPAPARRNRAGAPTKEEEEKEEKGKKAGREPAADPKGEEKKLNMDALAFQVSVEDLRTHMGITLVREDAVKLMRRWEQKSRDNSIRLLLDDPKATQHPYALVPRITRFIKDGQMVQVNVLNLVRHFFQLFENVPQVVQLKNEPFFVTEVPTLEWAIVACEALPDTLNKTVLEQRTIFGHYIQKFMSNERRVRRRVLVEALYDIIVLNMVCKEPILRKTVDLTETRRGRQTQMCVNFGAKGIRVSSIARDQRHPQMGMCPSW